MLLYEISPQVFFLFLKLGFSEYLEQWLMLLVLTLLKEKEYRQSESEYFCIKSKLSIIWSLLGVIWEKCVWAESERI